MLEQYPKNLVSLIACLKKLPGVGSRTAERFAFELLSWQQQDLSLLSELLRLLPESTHYCPTCFCLEDEKGCLFCDNPHRDPGQVCIVASAKDIFAIEKTQYYRGVYHVLGGVLSPINHSSPDHLNISSLFERLKNGGIKEIIIALDSTLEGDATSLYLKKELSFFSGKITRLAYGIPIGSPLEYVDGNTLSKALSGRQNV